MTNTATLETIDFSLLGSNWLRPSRRGQQNGYYDAYRPDCERRLSEFVERYGVRPYQHRYRNLLALLSQGGKLKHAIHDVLCRHFGQRHGTAVSATFTAAGSPFDHVELWGRDKTPLFLIGHPYGLDNDAHATLEAIRGLGLEARIDGTSWYGFSTVQVRVFHWATVVAKTEQPS